MLKLVSSLTFLLYLVLMTPQKASAYVDPGSGAMLWQLLAAAMLGSLFYFRRFLTWVRQVLTSVTTVFRRSR